MNLEEKLERVVARHDELRDGLASHEAPGSEDYIRMTKEYADLTPVVENIDAVENGEDGLDVTNAKSVTVYKGWFLDNGLIANPVDRVVGQISMGGQNDSGSYLATVVSTADQVFVQLTVE